MSERDNLRELNASLVAEVNRLGTDLASARAERDEERDKRDDLIQRYQQVCNDHIELQNENALLLAKLDRQRVDADLARRNLKRVSDWHSPSTHADEIGLCAGCGQSYPCQTRQILDGNVNPGECLCGADLGPPWDSTPHRRGSLGCREDT